MMDSFSGAVPASVICVARVGTSVHLGLFNRLNALVLQALLNFEELLSSRLIGRVSGRADSIIPSGAFRSQEVSIDGVLNIRDGRLCALMTRVRVLIPPVEARLIPSIIQLAVMD